MRNLTYRTHSDKVFPREWSIRSHRTFVTAVLAAAALGLGLLSQPVSADTLGYKLIQDAKSCSLADVQQDLANGANVNATDPNDGRTALMLNAEWCFSGDIASTLVAHGANVNARDNKGETALMWAASGGDNVEVTRVLLAHGADVNAKANDGSTPLGWARSDPMSSGDVASLLQAAGAQ